ncbi:MAG TPA: zinc-ribbon domain-containing protein [Candidatus Binatia bacterium]|nr:zinc-ribbon domain-containing protein [Candidatus Binatia bacterium]
MLIRCPSCNTNYKLSDEVLKGTVAVFRCSRCKHTFDLEAAKQPQNPTGSHPTPAEGGPGAEDQRELSFSFAPNESSKENHRIGEDLEFGSAPVKPAESPLEDGEAAEWSITASDAQQEKPFTIAAADHRFGDKQRLDGPEPPPAEASVAAAPSRGGTDNILSLDPYRDQPASIKPYLTLFGLLMVFFLLVTALHQVDPTTAEKIIRKVPLVGRLVLKNDHLKSGVALQSLRAGYQTIQGNREVFVVTGMAQNRNPVVIREVRLSGRVYDGAGKAVEHQMIWLGNAISPKIIRGMTAQDVADLQRLSPLKTFGIPPGDSVPFAIVFMKATKGITNFTCEVLAAESEI